MDARTLPETRAVIFDIDGTLIDSVNFHARSWVEAFAEHGLELGFDEVRKEIGKGGDKLLPEFLSPEQIDELGEKLEAARARIVKDKYLAQIEAFPDVRKLFERLLASGKQIALASSAKAEELQSYKRIARIDDLTLAETSSDDAEESKPAPGIFVAALKRLGDVRPEEVVAVGDTPYDAEAARKAGIRAVGVICGGWSAVELRLAGCVAVYADPADILATLDTSPLA